MMKCFKFFYTIISFLVLIELNNGLQCRKSGFICINSHEYQECSFINGEYNLTGAPILCPTANPLCDNSTGTVICRPSPSLLTATELSVQQPNCSETSKHPAPACYQFYECVYVMWWWEAQLKTCPETQCYDIWLKECAKASLVDCQTRTPLPGVTTTTISTTRRTTKASTLSTSLSPVLSSSSTTAGSVTIPTCSGPGKYPALFCSQYYECEQNFLWWQPVLKTCVVGYAFDILIIACLPLSVVDCQNRITTTTSVTSTTSTTTTTTTLGPPVFVVPTCSGPGKHPSPNCYEYYECEQVAWWWKPQLKACIIGQAFDIILIACMPITLVDCQNRITTTGSTTLTTKVTSSLAPPIIVVPTCSGPGKYPAPNCNEYYECEQVAWWWEPRIKFCAIEQAFDIILIACAPIKLVDCQNRITPSISTTTIQPPVPPIIVVPTCSGPGKHPALNCNEYYECEQVWWWWEPHLKTCLVGQAFDIILIVCAPVKQVDCQNRITTTVSITSTTTQSPVPPIIAVPTCSGPGKHPSLNCNEYYECEQVWWWWEPHLKTCLVGQAFDVILIVCAPVKQVDCQNRLTTVSTTITTTHSPLPPVIVVPTCSGPGKHPAPNCYEYYECEQVAWWWEPHLKVCAIGQAFDIILIACAPIQLVECQNRITTTISTTTSTTLAPPIIVTPTCSGPGKYPAESCYEYYECVQVAWWWEPQIKTCIIGQAFDIILVACAPVKLVDCQNRIRTTISTTVTTSTIAPPIIVVPTCSGPGRYPAPICYQYYQCKSTLWWWEVELITCPPEEGYDILLSTCYPIKYVDCQQRITTPSPTSTTAVTPTTKPPSTEIPKCYGFSRHPASLCYQFYECVPVWWWWEPKLKTCPDGEGYDHSKERCLCAEAISCKVPIKEPKCSDYGKYPAPKCNQYYECVSSLWWWIPQLKTCPKGQGFASSVMRCVDEGYDCKLLDDSSENSSKENGSKENNSKENVSKENTSKEDSSKEKLSKKNTQENLSKKNRII